MSPRGISFGADSRDFLEVVRRIHRKVVDEILDLNEGGARSSFPQNSGKSRKVDPERFGVGFRSCANSVAGRRQVSATERRILHPTTGGSEEQEGRRECPKQG